MSTKREKEIASSYSTKLTSDNKWLIERCEFVEFRTSVKNVIFDGDTKFQHVAIIDTYQFGRVLIVDGEVQSAEADEYAYHEALVHPVMLTHANPQKVLIVGGGEGATLREILKYPSVNSVSMVDIDAELINLVKLHMSSWHQGAFNDPRIDLHITDGALFLRSCTRKFDVVVVDVCDYVEGTAVESIYSSNFFSALKNVLAIDGVVVVQSGKMEVSDTRSYISLLNLIKTVFPGFSLTYSTYIGSFFGEWSFLLAGNIPKDYGNLPSQSIDKRIAEQRLTGRLKFYDGVTHGRMFYLQKNIRDSLCLL